MSMFFLAQNDFPAGEMPDAAAAAGAAFAGLMMLISFAVSIVSIIGIWKVYSKANKPGWACLVPIYNLIVGMEIIGRPAWWFLLMLIPFAGIIFVFIAAIDLAKSFGKGAGFGVGLVLLSPIFSLILGFGSAQYVGPAAAEGTASA